MMKLTEVRRLKFTNLQILSKTEIPIDDEQTLVKKFIALFDIHFGWEKQYNVSTGKFKEKPTHDLKFLNQISHFISDFRPEVCILGGDQFNFDVLRANRNGKKDVITRDVGDIERAYKVAQENLFLPLSRYPFMQKVVIRGNHDQRLERYLRGNPEWAGMVEPQNYLQLTTPDWTWLDYGSVYRLGKLNFLHGETIRSKATDSAKRAASMYLKNVRFGHFHTYAAATLYSAIDEDIKTAISVPCCCTRDMEWMGKSPNTWIQGFLYGYVHPNGNFQDYVVIRGNKGSFVVEGKEY